MAALNATQNVRVISRGFSLLRDMEKQQDKRISLEEVSKETGLAKMTVRRFLAKGSGDVSGSQLAAAAVIANYLGVDLGALVDVQVEANAEDSDNG